MKLMDDSINKLQDGKLFLEAQRDAGVKSGLMDTEVLLDFVNIALIFSDEIDRLKEENERLKSEFRKLMDYHREQIKDAIEEWDEAKDSHDQSWEDACEASVKTSHRAEVHLFRVMKANGLLDDGEIEFGTLKQIKVEGTE